MNVWVTREEPVDGPLSAALRDAGLVPVLEPVIERRVLDGALDELAGLGPDDWLVLTSAFAIRAMPSDARTPRVAVVGVPSQRAAEAKGMRVELVGHDGGATALFEELGPLASGKTVLYPRSSAAPARTLPDDVTLISPVLYETAPRAFRTDVIDEIDVIAVASPSAVRAIGAVERPFASIGATTTGALRALDIEPWVEAPEPTFPALALAIAALT